MVEEGLCFPSQLPVDRCSDSALCTQRQMLIAGLLALEAPKDLVTLVILGGGRLGVLAWGAASLASPDSAHPLRAPGGHGMQAACNLQRILQSTSRFLRAERSGCRSQTLDLAAFADGQQRTHRFAAEHADRIATHLGDDDLLVAAFSDFSCSRCHRNFSLSKGTRSLQSW